MQGLQIKLKDRIYPLDYSSIVKITIILKNAGGIWLGDSTWEVPSTVTNFKTFYGFIKPSHKKEFLDYFNQLKEEAIKKKQGEVSPENKAKIILDDIRSKFPHLYDFQVRGVAKISHSKFKGFLLGYEQGLGKTVTSISAVQYMNKNNIWIICPANLINQWKGEIKTWAKEIAVAYNLSKAKREKLYKECYKWNIISYETFRIDIENKDLRARLEGASLIVDESTKLKNKKSGIYKAFQKIEKTVDFKLFMSGTPVNNALQDIDNVVRLINRTITGNINEHLVWEQQSFGYGWNAKIINVVVGYKNLDSYNTKIKPVYYRKRKDEVATQLPKKTITTLTIEQPKLYHDIKDEILENLTAFTGFTLLQTLDAGLEVLAQSTSETVELMEIPEMFEKVSKEITNPKLGVLSELIEQIGEKTLIFTRFVRATSLIKAHLQKEFPKKRIEIITGGSGNSEELRQKFNETDEVDIVIATDTWSKGVNLDKINYMINFDIPTSIEFYLQRQDRIHRINSKLPKFIYNLAGDIVERHVLDLLEEKLKLIEQITEGKGESYNETDIKKEVMMKLGFKFNK